MTPTPIPGNGIEILGCVFATSIIFFALTLKRSDNAEISLAKLCLYL